MARLIRPLAAGVVGILLLCMPAFLNRSTILFTDSQSYYVGGHMVIDRAVTVIDHLLHPATGPIGAAVVHAKAVRSIYYSLLSYLLADTASLWAISVVQAALTVWVIAVTINTFQPTRRLLPILVALMLLSTLPWTVSMFMPDIFTPLTILAIACLAFAWPDLSRNMRLALLVMLSSSIVMHFTNVPIAVGLCGGRCADVAREALGARGCDRSGYSHLSCGVGVRQCGRLRQVDNRAAKSAICAGAVYCRWSIETVPPRTLSADQSRDVSSSRWVGQQCR